MKRNRYQCKHCGKIIDYDSDRAWIRSYCEEAGKDVHLMKILNEKEKGEMPKFNVDIHFDVYCARCGKGICSNCDTDIESKSSLKMRVEPCKHCLDKEMVKIHKWFKKHDQNIEIHNGAVVLFGASVKRKGVEG